SRAASRRSCWGGSDGWPFELRPRYHDSCLPGSSRSKTAARLCFSGLQSGPSLEHHAPHLLALVDRRWDVMNGTSLFWCATDRVAVRQRLSAFDYVGEEVEEGDQCLTSV